MYFCKKNGKNVAECSFRITTPSAAVLKKKTHILLQRNMEKEEEEENTLILWSPGSHMLLKSLSWGTAPALYFPECFGLYPLPTAQRPHRNSSTLKILEFSFMSSIWMTHIIQLLNDPSCFWEFQLICGLAKKNK